MVLSLLNVKVLKLGAEPVSSMDTTTEGGIVKATQPIRGGGTGSGGGGGRASPVPVT